jgi:hypothetical protein
METQTDLFYLNFTRKPIQPVIRNLIIGVAALLLVLVLYTIVRDIFLNKVSWDTFRPVLNGLAIWIAAILLWKERNSKIEQAFVRISPASLEFKNENQKDSTTVLLDHINEYHLQWNRIDLKPIDKPWLYINVQSRAKAKLIFEHLQTAVEMTKNTQKV